MLRGDQALERLLQDRTVQTVLDVGTGTGHHAELMRRAGLDVTTIAIAGDADYVGDFLDYDGPPVDAIWACHVLEHCPDPGAFLRHCRRLLKPGGLLVVTVPPAKHNLVGGHVTLWNPGLLVYQLVLAGFDCSTARVASYDYNISALVHKGIALALAGLTHDEGDIERLAPYFPWPVHQNIDGRLPDVHWSCA